MVLFAGLRERALAMREHTPTALSSTICGVTYEICWYMRGLERWFVDTIEHPVFCEALLDRTYRAMAQLIVQNIPEVKVVDLGDGARAPHQADVVDVEEVAEALGRFGYKMKLVSSFMHLARKERPTLWSWMQKPRNAWAHYILAIHKGKEGHWILVKGVKMCDTFTEGRWTFVCDGPHRGCRIMEVFEVKRDLDF